MPAPQDREASLMAQALHEPAAERRAWLDAACGADKPLRQRRALGPGHPYTLIAMFSLAESFHDLGRLEEALKLREELLPLMRKVNGPAHAYTLAAMKDLAESYQDAGRKDEADALRNEAATMEAKSSTKKSGQ